MDSFDEDDDKDEVLSSIDDRPFKWDNRHHPIYTGLFKIPKDTVVHTFTGMMPVQVIITTYENYTRVDIGFDDGGGPCCFSMEAPSEKDALRLLREKGYQI
jgi:hypothetical protein